MKNLIQSITRAAAAMLLLFSTPALAQVPDLTNGGVPTDSYYINLGPTGLAVWVHSAKVNGFEGETTNARQFLVRTVDAGSPAYGILAANDVILGADGTGAVPGNFTYDARQAFAAAINDAEARSPATLKVLRWRAGVTNVVDLTLQTLGGYSATAPYNCPKSALILENAVQKMMIDGESDSYGQLTTLLLLATDDDSHPDKVLRRAKAAAQARSLIPTQDKMDLMMNGSYRARNSPSWKYGFELIVLSEYYLATGDPDVIPAIQAISNMLGNGADMFGCFGHGFGEDATPSVGTTLAIPPYGTVNAAGLPCFLGLALAEKAGLATPAALNTLENANNFYGSFVNRGAIPYGENHAGIFIMGSNGKAGNAALAFSLQPERAEEARYHALLAAAASRERQVGHSSAWFSQFWTPLGTAVGGEQAVIEHFDKIHWMLDLNRTWDGGFDYNALTNGVKGSNTPAWRESFYASVTFGLTYALPLKKIALTGKYANPALAFSASELEQVALSADYDADALVATRTNAELLNDLSVFSAVTREIAGREIKARTSSVGYFLPALIAMASDHTNPGCRGACAALGYIGDPSTIPLSIDLLTCPDVDIRWIAAESLRYYKQKDLLPYSNQIIDIVIANAKPVLPLDPDDPLQDVQGKLAYLLFYGGNADGPKGIHANSLAGIDKGKMFQVVRIISKLPRGGGQDHARKRL